MIRTRANTRITIPIRTAMLESRRRTMDRVIRSTSRDAGRTPCPGWGREGRRRWRRPSGWWVRLVLRGRNRWVQEPTEQAREVGERIVATLVERVVHVPLDRVRQDDIVGIERRSVMEGDAVAQRAGPLGQFGIRLAFSGQCRDGGRPADCVAVKGLSHLLTNAQRLAV